MEKAEKCVFNVHTQEQPLQHGVEAGGRSLHPGNRPGEMRSRSLEALSAPCVALAFCFACCPAHFAVSMPLINALTASVIPV